MDGGAEGGFRLGYEMCIRDRDKSVQMVLFGGGESAVEILPYIDYENIRRYPKLFSSYSDGTSILNAIYAQTGLLTYYGCGPGAVSYTHLDVYKRQP